MVFKIKICFGIMIRVTSLPVFEFKLLTSVCDFAKLFINLRLFLWDFLGGNFCLVNSILVNAHGLIFLLYPILSRILYFQIYPDGQPSIQVLRPPLSHLLWF